MYHSSWKLTLLTATLTLSANVSLAEDIVTKKSDAIATQNCPLPPKLHSGWYLGAQLGYDAMRVRNSVVAPGSSTFITNPVLAVNGWATGLMLGYGDIWEDWFYLAIEIFANANNFSNDFSVNDTTAYSNTFNTSSTIGLGFLPGVKFTDATMAYARLGWNRVIIKTTETVTGTATMAQTNDSSGFVLGVGIETLLVTQWSLRTEFDHMTYNSFNTTVPYRTKVSPSDNQLSMGIIYHFDDKN